MSSRSDSDLALVSSDSDSVRADERTCLGLGGRLGREPVGGLLRQPEQAGGLDVRPSLTGDAARLRNRSRSPTGWASTGSLRRCLRHCGECLAGLLGRGPAPASAACSAASARCGQAGWFSCCSRWISSCRGWVSGGGGRAHPTRKRLTRWVSSLFSSIRFESSSSTRSRNCVHLVLVVPPLADRGLLEGDVVHVGRREPHCYSFVLRCQLLDRVTGCCTRAWRPPTAGSARRSAEP